MKVQLDVEQGTEEDLGSKLNDTRYQIEVSSITKLVGFKSTYDA